MNFILIGCFILVAFYLLMVIFFIIGWEKLPEFELSPHRMNGKFPVSVVVSCHNEEEHLPRLLSALLRQTFSDFELVLVDDHSTDGTYKIMQEFSSAFSNMKFFQSELKGRKMLCRKP
jgi:cellulose synthase/poly-beta-1,6-N-acetylglucosamine synthase-like glycosyltransferase